MTIEVVLPAPRGKQGAARPAGPRHIWKPLPAKPVIGLIDNSKTRASDLLENIARILERRGIAASHFMIRKPTASHTITQEDRAQLLARAHMIVSGIGD